MTDELKTLKDLEYFDHTIDNGADIDHGAVIVRSEILKAEAIKWIKRDASSPKLLSGDFKSMPIDIMNSHEKYLKEWIKHFFNISEEDLK